MITFSHKFILVKVRHPDLGCPQNSGGCITTGNHKKVIGDRNNLSVVALFELHGAVRAMQGSPINDKVEVLSDVIRLVIRVNRIGVPDSPEGFMMKLLETRWVRTLVTKGVGLGAD